MDDVKDEEAGSDEGGEAQHDPCQGSQGRVVPALEHHRLVNLGGGCRGILRRTEA